MRYLPVFSSAVPPYEKNATDTCQKIAIDCAQYHDHRDVVQTNHAENENAARGG